MRLQGFHLPSAMRLALMLSALFSVSAIVAGAVAYVVMSDELRARLYDDARLEATALAAELQSNGPDELITQIRSVSAVGDGRATLYFFQPPGSGRSVGNMALSDPFAGPRVLVSGQDFTALRDPEHLDGEVYFAYGLRAADSWIVVARDSQWVTDSQEVLIQSVAWGLAVALLATVALAFVIGRRNARRTLRLNQVLASVAAGDLAARYPDIDDTRDDIGELARSINVMLERLSANVERLTQVSADIAHDLRSPLTRLRLRLEPHVLRPDIPEETRMAIAASLDGLDGISAGFDAILQLSQMETGNLKIQTSSIDLADLARQVHEMMLPVAEEMGNKLGLQVPDGTLMVTANAELLSQALVNLVENALRHAPSPVAVAIIVTAGGGDVRLTVADNGPGIPASERDKVVRRFYRLDQSRNRPGTGLGLSLVMAIARLHGGRLDLEDNAPGLRAALIFDAPA